MAFSLAGTACFPLKISWRFRLITTVRFWRGCQKSNLIVEFYLIQWKNFFVPFHIRKAENPWKGFRRCSLASIRGFEPPPPCLGELLNNCHTCSPEFTVVVRCLPTQISSFECENPTAIELKIETWNPSLQYSLCKWRTGLLRIFASSTLAKDWATEEPMKLFL